MRPRRRFRQALTTIKDDDHEYRLAGRSVKTEASGKPIPLDDTLIEELLLWRTESPYADHSD
jgi:hypothetical protein